MENSRRPILEIGKKIGVSGAAIHQRLRKLEKQNLIIGSSIKITVRRSGEKKALIFDIVREVIEIQSVKSNLIDQNIGALSNQKNMQFSKKNRFEVNAKDLIASHKWARENDLEVLCCAHSHPSDKNKPSEMDLLLNKSPGLMVISNKDGDLKAWWIKNKLNFHGVKIEIFSLT